MFRERSVRRAVARTVVAALLVQWLAPPAFAQSGPSTFASTVSAVSASPNAFIDDSLIGHSASEFTDRLIRLITSANPDGFVTRVVSFDSATGTFVLADPIPPASVAVKDVYLLGTTASVPPAIQAADATANADAIVNSGTIEAADTKFLTPVLTPPSPVPGASKLWSNVIKVDALAKGVDALAGADTVVNTGTVTADATGITIPSLIPAPVMGVKKADVSQTAKATATAIDGGDDSDAITNAGTLGATATANATAANVSIVEADIDAGSAALKGTVGAEATATGISSSTGNDSVTNRSDILDLSATTISTTLGGGAVTAVENKQTAGASAKSTSQATVAGIELGNGDATAVNTGAIGGTADALAFAVNVAVETTKTPASPPGPAAPESTKSKPSKLSSTSEGGAEAQAKAVGISMTAATSTGLPVPDLNVAVDSATLTVHYGTTHASGNGTVTNDGNIDMTAQATAAALGVGVSIDGNTSAKVSSSATASGTAIDLAGGDDTVTNNATLTATSTASADSLDISVAAKTAPPTSGSSTPAKEDKVSIKSATDAGATAVSRATGISADNADPDTSIDVTLTAARDADENFVAGLHLSQTSTQSSGNDIATNTGAITTVANASTAAVGLGASFDGAAASSVKSSASATGVAVDLGNGDDTLTNTATGTLTTTASANAQGLTVGIGLRTDATLKGDIKGAFDGTTSAQATARGVTGDASQADSLKSLDITFDPGDSIDVHARIEETRAGGQDTVTNTGAVSATAAATTSANAIGASIDGSASAKMESKAAADAAGIDLGGGNDTLNNFLTGSLSATATATADATNISFGLPATGSDKKTKVEAAVEGGSTATARAAAAAADSLTGDTLVDIHVTRDADSVALSLNTQEVRASGNDTVINDGSLTATANSQSGTIGVGITVNGSAAAKATSTANSNAAGVDLGAGNDYVNNSGTVTATSDALATSVNLAAGIDSSTEKETPKAKQASSSAEAGATAESRATGLSADAAVADSTTILNLEVPRLNDLELDADVVKVGYQKTEERPGGDDTVVNTGDISATSTATTVSASIGLAVKGKATADSSSSADAQAVAIDLGRGRDDVTNSGLLNANATSIAGAIGVALTNKGRTGADEGDLAPKPADGFWKGGIESKAAAFGIDGAGGGQSTLAGVLQIDSNTGIFAAIGTTKGDLTDQAKTITNSSGIIAESWALSGSIVAAASSEGFGGVRTHSSNDAQATAIRAGQGADVVRNLNSSADELTVTTVVATATGGALSAAVSGKGFAVAADTLWDAGTKIESKAFGIDADGGNREEQAVGVLILPGQARLEARKVEAAGGGNDQVLNAQQLTVASNATADSLTAALSGRGLASAVSTVETDARAGGIRGGAGDDDLRNRGSIATTATATTNAAAGTFESSGVAISGSMLLDGGIKADATAVGIDGDGIASTTTTASLTLDENTATLDVEKKIETASGNDSITNTGTVDATASASSDTAGVSVVAKGVAVGATQSTATAEAAAARGGTGDDAIRNRGTLTASADATARSLNIAVSAGNLGAALVGNAVWDGGVTGDATAIGIDGDGASATTTHLALDRTTGTLEIQKTVEVVGGKDLLINTGTVAATANATSESGGGSLAVNGLAATVTQAAAQAAAGAIRGGAGDDTITNLGALTSDATAIARALNVAITADAGGAVAGDALWDGGIKADAASIGIDGDGGAGRTNTITTISKNGDHFATTTSEEPPSGNDTITNSSTVTVTATARTPEASVPIAVTGVALAASTSTAGAVATAVAGGGGDDTVTNTSAGTLDATATSLAATAKIAGVNVGGAIATDAMWDGGTRANAAARGIDAGLGSDTVVNDATVNATSNAVTASAALSGAVTGAAIASANSTATSRATALDAGDNGVDADGNPLPDSGTDNVTNTGTLTANANGLATAAAGGVTNVGFAGAVDTFWDNGTTADVSAKGIATGDGADTVVNTGVIDATALGGTAVADAAIAVTGAAAAMTRSTTFSKATGIDTAGANDEIRNLGALTTSATSAALSAAVSVTTAGAAVSAGGASLWDGGTTSDARAVGIASGSGSDLIGNGARIDSSAFAGTGSADVSVAVSGFAAGVGTSSSIADAAAIDAGDHDDRVRNVGVIGADATALAGTVTVGFTSAGVAVAGDSSWNGGTSADATAQTIRTGQGNDSIGNDGDVTATSHADTASVPVSVALTGGAVAIGTSNANARSTAIDSGDGDDRIDNRTANIEGRRGLLTATAIANGTSASISVTPAGAALAGDSVWDGGTKANATANGIDAGNGNDRIDNAGDVVSSSTARTLSAAVTVPVTGFGLSISDSTATSNATGIATAADDHTGDDVNNSGHLDVDAIARAASVPISVTTAGVTVAGGAVWDGGTTGDASARGIATGQGADRVANAGRIDAFGDAISGTAAVSVSLAGIAVAAATSDATANASAIDTSGGNDDVSNTGILDVDTSSLAATAIIPITPAGVAGGADAFWDGGTHADATSRAITSGDGDDRIRNNGNITADSNAGTASVNITVAVAGVGAAVGTSNALATTAAIDAGDGDDRIVNRNFDEPDHNGRLTSTATATAAAPTINVVPFGVAVSTDAVWDGGTTAGAAVTGIDAGTGADTVFNDAAVDATANARTLSASATVNVFGVAASIATSTSLSSATAIQTGAGTDAGTDPRDGATTDETTAADGDDTVVNSGSLTATANSRAIAGGIGFTFGGVSAAGTSTWDGGTYSDAAARGISTGAGIDTVVNDGQIASASHAITDALTASIAVFGVTGAVSTGTANARSAAIDAGAGDDVIWSLRQLTPITGATAQVTSAAEAKAVTVNIAPTLIGAAVAGDAAWQGGSHATATAAALDGGAGRDWIFNDATIDTTADSTVDSVAVELAVGGAGGAVATSNATSTASGITGGADDDVIGNAADISAASTATSNGVAVSVSGVGVSLAGSTWDTGTAATANAFGLSGGTGADRIRTTDSTIDAQATSITHSTSVAFEVGGIGLVAAGSTSTASSAAIDGGDDADQIVSNGVITSGASATASGVGVSVTGAGVSLAGSLLDNVTKADSTATGIAGGSGNDRVATTALAHTTVTSTAETTDTNVSVAVTGFSAADSQANATARGIGLDGGAGDDVLQNSGQLNGVITADGRAREVGVGLAGAVGHVGNLATTTGTGIDGGDGGDTVVNSGHLQMSSNATGRGQTVNVSTLAAVGGAGTTADATLRGLSGGAGTDTVINIGTVHLTPTGTATGTNVGVGVAGASVGDASAVANARATGLDGGLGGDVVTNAGFIRADIAANGSARSTGVVVAGASLNHTDTTSLASATGADGGDDNDVVQNTAGGTIELVSRAVTTAHDTTVGIFGVAGGSSMTTPTATAVGLAGGAGNDTVINDGTLLVDSGATSTATGSRVNVAGVAKADVGTTATVGATGLSGGDGDDRDLGGVLNRGALTITGASTVDVDGSSWTLTGVANNTSTLNAGGTITGLNGDAGSDRVRNEGQLAMSLDAGLTIKNMSTAVFGGAGAGSTLTSTANAFGLVGGTGADVVENVGRIDVDANAHVTANKTSVSFVAGSPAVSALLTSNATVVGIDGVGDDADQLTNAGILFAKGSSVSSITGGAKTNVSGGGESTGTGSAQSTAYGIRGALALAGRNTITNSGLLDVTANSDSTVVNDSKAGLLLAIGTKPTANSSAVVDASGHGVWSANGDNDVVNTDRLVVNAVSNGYGFTSSTGAHLAIKGDAISESTATATVTASGVTLGTGTNHIVNDGSMNVAGSATTVKSLTTTVNVCEPNPAPDSDPDTPDETICHDESRELSFKPTYASANGNGASGTGRATATGTATVTSYALNAGDGANSFSNNDTITVTASPEARTVAFADNDAAGIADGTAVASATANAFGVLVGHGSNTLTNAGTMTISALPTAQADVSVTGGVEVSACIDYFFGTWCFTVDPGVERGTARATLGASAVGMSAGNGANTIVNSGVMTVEARPVIDVFAARTLHADSGESTVSTTSHSTATGILTGDGNNAILNDAGGIIDVRADGGSVCNGACTRTSNAYGIQTGSGDDVIVNRGEIKASAVNGSGTALAIDSGDGNDRVVLDEGSRTMAAVRLGAGDDRLVWGSSATLSATADGGSGTADVFALGGKTGSTFELSDIGTTFTGFERFHKEGASTWTLAGNRTIDWTVEQGRLQVQDQLTGTVATAAAGALNPEIGVLAGATLRRTDTAAVAVVNSDGLLANSGLVDSGAAGGVGVVTDGIGATVFNAGTLNATGTAVRMQGLDGLVVNSGLVQAAGSAIVMFGSGNTVQNDAAGVIQSGSGAAIVGGAGSDGVVNSGRVTGGAGTSLDLGGGSDQLVVSDVSRFDGVARGGDGIDTLVIDPSIHTFNLSSIGSLYDSFEIQKKQGASSLTLAGTGTGDWLLDAGTISLAGTLTGTLSTLAGGLNPILRIDPAGRLSAPGGAAAVILNGGALLENAGVIDGGVSGVVMTGAGNMLLNDGRINGSVDALGIAGRIENRGSIQSGDVGVRLFGEGSSIVNDGLIAAQSDGIQIGAGGAFLVNNGSIFSATGAAIRGSSGNDALFNNGLISAARGIAVDFAGGNDLLVMNGRSAFGGQVLGGAGSDVVQVASDSGNGVMNLSQFEGFELLQKLGNSTWQINGASDMAWDLAGGRLVVDGTLGGPGRVQANSILGGHGIVGSVSNSGVVAPGNSIGTLRVAGDYDHAATATLEVETDAAGASDRLIVNGVSVLRGGTLDIRPEAGRYGIATEYAFLASGGGVAGSFDTVTSSMATLDPLLEYSGQGATVVLVRNDVSFKAMADTANMADLGSVLDASKRSMARGDFRFAMNQFLDIDNAAQTDALATLTGELHGASVRSLLRTGDRFFASAVDRRPSAQVEGDRRLMWTDAVGYSGSVAGDGNASRASYRTTGLVGGIELLAGETGRVGASFGFAPGTTTLNRLGADKASSRSWMPAVYGEYDPGAWSVAVGAGYARHSVQTERRVNIGLVDRRAVASYDANQYSGMVRAGLRLPGTAMMSLKAFGEARYSSLAGGEFNESGADSLNLVDASRSDSSTLRTLAGIRAIWSPKFWNSALKPEVSAAWSHEAMDVRSGLSARIAGTTMFGSAPSFTSFGASEARNGAVVRVGASTGMTKHGNAYVTYDGNLSDRGSDNGFSAGVKMSW